MVVAVAEDLGVIVSDVTRRRLTTEINPESQRYARILRTIRSLAFLEENILQAFKDAEMSVIASPNSSSVRIPGNLC